MTPPLRPVPPGPQAQTPQRADPARLAAQRAFFDLAMGKAAAPPPPAAAAPAQAARPPAAGAAPTAQAEAPQKLLRPGSLLDIRV